MPDRTAPHRRRITRTAGLFLLSFFLLPFSFAAAAQPADDDADARPPLPPEPGRPPLAAKYRIPDPDRAIFHGVKDRAGNRSGGVEDGKPVASEKQNPDEAAAWAEVVRFAAGHPAAELERHAARDLTAHDLTHPVRQYHRLALVRLDGTLQKARRVPATPAVAAGGPAELFEGRLFPAGEPPTNPLVVVFTEWPAGLPEPPADGAFAPVDRWVAFAGYSFKLTLVPGPEDDPADPQYAGWKPAPLLIGRSVTPGERPLPAIPLDKGLRVFKLIRDDAPIARTSANWEEAAAWDRVVRHARQFTHAELDTAARRDLAFADLFEPGREAYQLDLVRLEGRLIRVKAVPVGDDLKAAGVTTLYEAWLVPKDEPRGNPVCLVLSELPPGVSPTPAGELTNHWAAAAGYYFKLMWYESAEPDPKRPGRNVWKKAPLLIGRSVTVRPAEADGPSVWVTWFAPALVGGLGLVGGTGLALAWWFRKGDRAARAAVAAARPANPFLESETGSASG
ncbi:MAG: hypothetical protein K2X82_00225 [Gemmataceae bacterium]|nr:hypothetical protein [Gemmataceae bacterium]